MLTTGELIARLNEKGVKNADIARVLDVSPSRVTEIKKGVRTVKLDEAAKLVAAFSLEDAPERYSDAVLKVIVQHIATVLGRPMDHGTAPIAEAAADLRAFAQFQADPAMRSSAAAAEGFFRGLRTRRPT